MAVQYNIVRTFELERAQAREEGLTERLISNMRKNTQKSLC